MVRTRSGCLYSKLFKNVIERSVYINRKKSSMNVAHLTHDLLITIKEEIKSQFQEIIKSQNEKVEKLESSVTLLQQHVKILKLQVDKNSIDTEEVEQYGRRLCLRIDGLPVDNNESSEDVLEKVKTKWVESGINIPDSLIDRAHRIGSVSKDRVTNEDRQSVIVRLTTFRHRTMIYRNRKKMEGLSVKLDLTRKRYKTLVDARKKVDGNEKVKFVFTDINCRLKVFMADGKQHFFSSLPSKTYISMTLLLFHQLLLNF